MNTVIDPYNIKELRISHSSRGLFKSCARKLEFRKFLSHDGYDETIAALVGICLHNGYQEYLKSNDIDKAMYAMMVTYPIHLCSNPMWRYSMEECYATLLAIINSGHLVEYELATIKRDSGVVDSAIEVPATIAIKGFNLKNDGHVYINKPNHIPVYYDMYIDAIMFNKLTGEYIILDIKTTKQDLDKQIYKYTFDEQLLPYALVLERMLGKPISTLSFKYLAVYVDIKNPQVKLYSFTKSQEDIHDWARGLYMDLMNIRTMYNMRWFPRNAGACLTFNRPCTYWDACQYSDVNIRSKLIEMSKKESNRKDRIHKPWVTIDLEMAA